MDFVPNHSSNKHVWFQKSVAREDPYTDFYVWKDPKGFDEDGKPIPPNNWVRWESVIKACLQSPFAHAISALRYNFWIITLISLGYRKTSFTFG